MTISTGISTALLRPQTFHRHIYLKGGRSLVSLPQRIALVGIKAAGGTATATVPVDLVDPADVDSLFGQGSELALMARMAFAVMAQRGGGPALTGVPLAAPSGVAATHTFTVTGTATAGGLLRLRIAGRNVYVGVTTGDTQNTIATAICNAIKALYGDLPGTAAVATNVVTFTHAHTGENGEDVLFEVVSYGGVTGSTVAAAAGTTGTGAATIATALDALAGLEFDAIALGNHKSADVSAILTSIATLWGPSEKKWRWHFIGETTTLSAATTLASAANHQGVIIGSCEAGRSLPGEVAAALAVAAFSTDRPNAGYNGLRLPLYQSADASAYSGTEVETALAAGVTPLTPVLSSTKAIVDGWLKIERLITTKTTENSLPFATLRDLAVSRTGVYMARQLDIGYAARFGAGQDDVLIDDTSMAQIRDMAVNMMHDAAALRILKNVEDDSAAMVVEQDPIADGRANVDMKYTVVMPLHQTAYVHRVTI